MHVKSVRPRPAASNISRSGYMGLSGCNRLRLMLSEPDATCLVTGSTLGLRLRTATSHLPARRPPTRCDSSDCGEQRQLRTSALPIFLSCPILPDRCEADGKDH